MEQLDQHCHIALELNRLKFVADRDGINAALQFARDLIDQYRKCVVHHNAPCSSQMYRAKYVIAIKVAKHLLKTVEGV